MNPNYRTVVIAALLMLTAFAAFGQTFSRANVPLTPPSVFDTPSPSASTAPREVVLFTGASFNGSGTPKVSGTIGGLYPFSDKSFGGLVADLSFRKSGLPQTNIRGEFAQQVYTVGKLPIFALFDVGGSFAASDPSAALEKAGAIAAAVVQNVGTNVGYMAATGVSTSIPLPFGGLYAFPAVRIVKGSLNDRQLVFGVNFGKKVRVSRQQ